MYLDAYFEAVEAAFAAIRSTQRDAIGKAAEAVANSLAHRGGWFIMDTGHMLRYEAFNRAGGLVALGPFSYGFSVESPLAHRTAAPSPDQENDFNVRTVALALDKGGLRQGDVLLINSNSGRTPNVIETALQCRQRGIVTIGVSSGAQMRGCDAAHPSGKKLFDVVDVVIDTCGPLGDAAVEVRDNEKMCPISGLGGTYVLWAIQAEAVERLQARGVNPTIYCSVHVGGPERVDALRRQFAETGV